MGDSASGRLLFKELCQLLDRSHWMGLYMEVVKHCEADQLPQLPSRIYINQHKASASIREGAELFYLAGLLDSLHVLADGLPKREHIFPVVNRIEYLEFDEDFHNAPFPAFPSGHQLPPLRQ